MVEPESGGGGHIRNVCHENLQQIVSLENLFLAWWEFRRGKQSKGDVQLFEFQLEDNLFHLHEELKSKLYQHSHYTPFYITDPKLRHIHKASVHDRVLHHAIFRIFYPIFDKSFIFDSYSCRDNKGTHRAVDRLEQSVRKLSKNYTRNIFALKCDISKYFDSLVSQYSMPQEWADELLLMLEKDRMEATSINSEFLQGFRLQMQETERKLKRLLEMYLAEDIEQENYRQEKALLLSQKKSLNEQIARLERTSLVWLEPMQNFIKDAVNAGETTLSPSVLELKAAAQKIFGSNLYLKTKLVSGTPIKQWDLLLQLKHKTGQSPASCDLAQQSGSDDPFQRVLSDF